VIWAGDPTDEKLRCTVSEDAGETWSPANEGPTNCSVEDLFWVETLVLPEPSPRACFEFLSRLVQSEHLMVELCHFLQVDCSRTGGDEDKILLQ
jgi:hypothetical protein